jgi:hypothetical protein
MTLTLTSPNILNALQEQGFAEGPPAHLDAVTLMADIDAYRRLVCGSCGHRHHAVNPFHSGREYRLVCVCRSCGEATEV